jgi:F-type H+-transporting ATPase subunit b
MRKIRLLLAALAIGLLSSLSLAAPAHAVGDSEEVCLIKAVYEFEAEGESYDVESGKFVVDGEKVKLPSKEFEEAVSDCFEAPNPLLPEINEVIWGAVGFFIVLGVLYFKAVPAIKATMDARSERIAGDLAAAEAQRTEAEAVHAQYQAQLADARQESARIVEEARQAADSVRTDLVAKAEADAAEIRARAAADADGAKAQAIADLRGEVAALAIGAAEQVVGRSLDRDTNVALVEAYIDQVGADS